MCGGREGGNWNVFKKETISQTVDRSHSVRRDDSRSRHPTLRRPMEHLKESRRVVVIAASSPSPADRLLVHHQHLFVFLLIVVVSVVSTATVTKETIGFRVVQ